MTSRRRLLAPGRCAFFFSLVALTAGCGGGGPTLHPVSGLVLVDDQPAGGATLVFHPVNSTAESLRPGAVVGADGRFSLNTHPHGPGAPEGEYVVLVTWFNSSSGKGDSSDGPKSRLPNRYANAAQSGLKATVKPGENVLEPFKLSQKAR